VGPETATLNARGTANNGPAHSFFEYWVNGASHHIATDTRQWPSGASGPFSEKVQGLYAGKTYHFRLCGGDNGTVEAVCAQTRQFTTGAPVQDSAMGYWGDTPHFFGDVNAHSGPAGQSPQGTMFARNQFAAFSGSVTCLRVNRLQAAVGAVGSYPGTPDAKETMLLSIVDGGPSGTDGIKLSIVEGSSTPPNCASASFANPVDIVGDLVVNDAP
jgi:hypothetical protein